MPRTRRHHARQSARRRGLRALRADRRAVEVLVARAAPARRNRAAVPAGECGRSRARARSPRAPRSSARARSSCARAARDGRRRKFRIRPCVAPTITACVPSTCAGLAIALPRYSRAAFETRRCDPVKVRERWNNLLCKLSFCEVPSFSAIRSLLMFLAFRCAHRDTSRFRRLHDSFLPALRLLRPQVALSKVGSSGHCTGERGTKCNFYQNHGKCSKIVLKIYLGEHLVPGDCFLRTLHVFMRNYRF